MSNLDPAPEAITLPASVGVISPGVHNAADVLEALGVRVDLEPDRVARCIDEVGIGICFAPLVHGAMKFAGPVRKQLGYRTIFNNGAGAGQSVFHIHLHVIAGRPLKWPPG